LLGATIFLVNYADQTFPSRLNITVNELSPSFDKTGAPSNIIATMVPSGPPTIITNTGGIIGYNISYKLITVP